MDVQHAHEKTFWTLQIRSSKNLGPTKYPREKRYPRRYDDTMAQDPRDPRWHDTHGI